MALRQFAELVPSDFDSARLNAAVGGSVALFAVALHLAALGFLNWDDNRFITANPLFADGSWAYLRAALCRVSTGGQATP